MGCAGMRIYWIPAHRIELGLAYGVQPDAQVNQTESFRHKVGTRMILKTGLTYSSLFFYF